MTPWGSYLGLKKDPITVFDKICLLKSPALPVKHLLPSSRSWAYSRPHFLREVTSPFPPARPALKQLSFVAAVLALRLALLLVAPDEVRSSAVAVALRESHSSAIVADSFRAASTFELS